MRRLIHALFVSRSPSNISGLVMAVVVYPVKRVHRAWAQTYVMEKSGEVASPIGMHGYAVCAVAKVFLIAGIFAALLCFSPRSVFGAGSARERVPVLSFGATHSGDLFAVQAATRTSAALIKLDSARHVGFAAVAKAFAPFRINVGDYNEPSVASSNVRGEMAFVHRDIVARIVS